MSAALFAVNAKQYLFLDQDYYIGNATYWHKKCQDFLKANCGLSGKEVMRVLYQIVDAHIETYSEIGPDTLLPPMTQGKPNHKYGRVRWAIKMIRFVDRHINDHFFYVTDAQEPPWRSYAQDDSYFEGKQELKDHYKAYTKIDFD